MGAVGAGVNRQRQSTKRDAEDRILVGGRNKSFFSRISLDCYLLVRGASTIGSHPPFGPLFSSIGSLTSHYDSLSSCTLVIRQRRLSFDPDDAGTSYLRNAAIRLQSHHCQNHESQSTNHLSETHLTTIRSPVIDRRSCAKSFGIFYLAIHTDTYL